MPDSAALVLPAPSAGAGATLQWHEWPVDAPRAAVLLAHGYAEHFGRYHHVAAALNAKGYAVFAVDHWGHGRSEGIPGFVPSFSAYTDGVSLLRDTIAATHPGLPVFLIGHSMGGLIAVNHLIAEQARYAGAILSGPALAPAEPPSRLMIIISRFLSRFFPRVGVLALDAKGVSRDAKVVAAYEADPLVYRGKIGARLAAEMFDAMAAAQAGAGSIRLPMLILHGSEDSLAAPAGSQQFVERLGSSDKALKIYPGLFHEIFNEPEQADVLADVTHWLDGHMPEKVAG